MRRVIVASLLCPLVVLAVTPSASAQSLEWVRQFGTRDLDTGRDVVVIGSSLYVVGDTFGTLRGQTSTGGTYDAFVRKMATGGDVTWTIQFGSHRDDDATSVAADTTGLYVAGWTNGRLPGSERSGSSDGFLSRYEPSGALSWRRQFGTERHEYVDGVATDATGVYVLGSTGGVLRRHGDHLEQDVFVRKYDTGGSVLWTRQFGTDGQDSPSDISVKGTAVYVTGETDGRFPGQPREGATDAFVRKLTRRGTTRWTRQFSVKQNYTFGEGVAATRTGVYVTGSTVRVEGNDRGFLRSYTADGAPVWTRVFAVAARGSTGAGSVGATSGRVYVVGSTGFVPGAESTDVFVRAFDVAGSVKWTARFGTERDAVPHGADVNDGAVYVAGEAAGSFPGQTDSGVQTDAFVALVR
jgi:hypothetical protein